MRISVKQSGKILSHAVLGPGGYTRISYKVRFATRSLSIQIAKVFRLKRTGRAGRAEFASEHSVVDAAAERFYDAANAHRDLRRDIHRLEKGVTARNRRALFGLEPCAGVITALERQSCQDRSTLTWAYSVLSRYFTDLADGQNDTLVNLRRRFELLKSGGIFENVALVPYQAYPHGIDDSESLDELIQNRRSVRRFSPQPIDRAALEAALQLAVHAPSACNRLPYRFILLDEREKIENVGGLAAGTAGWLDNIPCLMVVVGDWSYYADINDRHTPIIDSSFAVIQLLLKLKKEGMGGCVINWKNLLQNDQRLRDFVKLAPWEQAITLVAIGYPETTDVPISIKKDPGTILSWNT